MDDLKIDLNDPQKEENIKFSNLVDPILLSMFMDRLKDPHEKRSLKELFDLLLEGR